MAAGCRLWVSQIESQIESGLHPARMAIKGSYDPRKIPQYRPRLVNVSCDKPHQAANSSVNTYSL